MRKVEKITLTLPKDLMKTVRAISPERGRSKFIAEAVAYYIELHQHKTLRERLVKDYQAAGSLTRADAVEWRKLDEEAWFIESTNDDPGN